MPNQIPKHIQDFCDSVSESFLLGNVESSYYQPICTLLEAYGCGARDLSGGRDGQRGENIDIKLWYSPNDITQTEPFAGVEAKKVGGIDDRAKGEQINALTERFGNAILTDNLVWYFYHMKNGNAHQYTAVRLIRVDANKRTFIPNEDDIEAFESLIKEFLLKDPVTIKSSVRLAEYMARHANTIRALIKAILRADDTGQPLVERQAEKPMFRDIYSLYCKIKETLRPYLDTKSFADIYAQTVVYGLFIARYNETNPENFNRYEAIRNLRKESDLLKLFFSHIATSNDPHPTLENVIDRLCGLYRITDVVELLDKDEEKDTIIHFYEEFLSFYDPKLRKELGVFYTPYQLVQYMVRMVDKILIEDFGITDGLANNSTTEIELPSMPYRDGRKEKNTIKKSIPLVSILDPACGTGTFHAEVIKYIKETYYSGSDEPFWDDYILSDKQSLMSRLIGFEIMMTSYVVAHLKIRRTIHETLVNSTTMNEIPPSRIYLTNTLAPPSTTLEDAAQMNLFAVSDFSGAVTEESRQADAWKSRRPVKVIIGNPPYLATSKTPYDIETFRTEADGVTKLKERNSKMLSDDYVKFFRFAEKIILRESEGIIAFVSNSGYLDNQVMRGMRASLLRTFDKILVVDLHGSAAKAKIDGIDKNVFEIRQGVSIFFGVKTSTDSTWGEVYHADLIGTRKSKLQHLSDSSFQYTRIMPDDKMVYFIPIENDNKDRYESGISVRELFPVSVVGAQSGNDKVAITTSRDDLLRRIENIKYAINDTQIVKIWGKLSTGQTAQKIQNDVLSTDGVVAPIAYNPFDKRWTFYSGKAGSWMDRPRDKKIMGHLLQNPTTPIGKNIGLVFGRSAPIKDDFAMIFISDTIIDKGVMGTVDKGYVAPLYLYDDINETWTPNFDSETFEKLTEHMTFTPKPIEIFDYIYGVLHDPNYRELYNEFLKRDFPRVPVINEPTTTGENRFYISEELFRLYVSAGERLRKLHLMQTEISEPLTLEPNTAEHLEVGAVKYKDGVLQMNPNKKIHGITAEVWNFRIGGYQVIDKWFKSHKGETLTRESFTHIRGVAGLLAETIKIQKELRNRLEEVR